MRPRILEEFVDAKDRARERAMVTVAAKEHSLPRKEKGKGKAAGEELSELTDERYDREMRSNGTIAQQEEWRGLSHEVRSGGFF